LLEKKVGEPLLDPKIGDLGRGEESGDSDFLLLPP